MNEIYTLVEKLKNDKDFIDLTNSNFGIPEFFTIQEDIISDTLNKYNKNRLYKPESKGILEARVSISNYYKSHYNCNIDANSIIITASTSESYNLLFESVNSTNAEVLIPRPSYPLIEHILIQNKLKPIYYDLDPENQWQPSITDIKSKLTPNTKFIIIISPNNPTGSIITNDNLNQLVEIAAENKTLCVLDEVFDSFVDGNIHGITTQLPLIRLNGISKMFALPDFKVGWLALQNVDQGYIEQLEILNDMYLNSSTFSQSLLPSLFENRHIIQEPIIRTINKNRVIVQKFITANKADINAIAPIGGIHCILKFKNIEQHNEEEFVLKILKEFKVLVHPSYFYDIKGDKASIILSYLNDSYKLEEGLKRLKNAI